MFNDKAVVGTDGSATFGNLVVQIHEDELIEEDSNFPIRFEVVGRGETAVRLPCNRKQLFAGIKFPMRLRECHITPTVSPLEVDFEAFDSEGKHASRPHSPTTTVSLPEEKEEDKEKFFPKQPKTRRHLPSAPTPTKRPVPRSRPRSAPEGTACGGCVVC